MNRLGTVAVLGLSTVAAWVVAAPSDARGSHTGIVERVWEDGFRLNTGNQTFSVDSWDVYGDNTAQFIRVGDRVTITGEFEGGEFDALTIQVNH
ncbi:hypothetical protein H6G20_25820 [Desertifilum sp. FACHB-1129]|uniref:DUF5666 domain-containing protein n=1 Tax=Desertifilum tharense IPPAS B-1220 TaxID=1781255 RepID=A0A1E5QGG0_9CYAN|nr:MULTISPECIES: hypothetical protein [Desertifilum]MDA0209284.1 hypothetical protein [Cyanobacteria bacterium FC1]MBD2315089.1 hypothetical protein [Desertifilum sp. FACHB-1129]MBD2325171.1 hypothetical protein [Desertifilum sp. FACHB-866]MBD2332687.1 hypothetical protein [Desertifilum sp. FACHB-868]OEJ73698.1 hypothetical protein BH720_18480 [Desertifilum tharense IPPAS B-1220]